MVRDPVDEDAATFPVEQRREVQVEADSQVSVMPQLFVKGLKFGLLLCEFVSLLLQLFPADLTLNLIML